jgi:hypothetical protein
MTYGNVWHYHNSRPRGIPEKCTEFSSGLQSSRHIPDLERRSPISIPQLKVCPLGNAIPISAGDPMAIKIPRERVEPDVDWAKVPLEARIAASLDHIYICRVYDVGEEEDIAFLAMKYVEDSSLRDALESGPLNPASPQEKRMRRRPTTNFSHHVHPMSL